MSSDAGQVTEHSKSKLSSITFLKRIVAPFPNGTFLQVAAFDPKGKEPPEFRCVLPSTIDSLVDFIEEFGKKKWNLHYAPNPLKHYKGSKASKDDIAGKCYDHADIDCYKGELPRETQREQAYKTLSGFEPSPTWVISSGNGLQALFQLGEFQPNTGNYQELERDNRLLAHLFGGFNADGACCNIDRQLRLPGTTNYPTKTKLALGCTAAQAEVLDYNRLHVYAPDALGLSLLPVKDAVRQLILQGVDENHRAPNGHQYPSRSEPYLYVVAELMRHGVRNEDALAEICNTPHHGISAHALAHPKSPLYALRRAMEHARRTSSDEKWQRDPAIRRDNHGNIVANEYNVMLAMQMAPELHGMLRFDAFALQIQFVKSPPWREAQVGEQWQDEDDTKLLALLQSLGIEFRGVNNARNCVLAVARDNTVHPARDYLNSLVWDGVPRLDTWLHIYLGAATQPAEYLTPVGRRFLIALCARAFVPGSKVDTMLVLEGPQGCGKSSTAELLAVRSDWFADSIGSVRGVHEKDAAMQLTGRLVIEFGELAALRHSDSEAIKGFVSRREDKFRPPYGRNVKDVPRQCVFVGTTNDDVYLKDRTGNRRYWPVKCGKIDLEALRRDRDQLLAEALQAFRKHEDWWLTHEQLQLAEVEQKARVAEDEIESRLAEFVAAAMKDGRKVFSSKHALVALGCFPDMGPSYAHVCGQLATPMANALARLGCSIFDRIGRGKTRRTIYVVPGVRREDVTDRDIQETLKIPQGTDEALLQAVTDLGPKSEF